jgi:hypothetical protein
VNIEKKSENKKAAAKGAFRKGSYGTTRFKRHETRNAYPSEA